MGGLGDVCLSESIFYSLSQHFARLPMAALGYPKFLHLFQDYFTSTHSIQSRQWMHLFTDDPAEPTWERIVFIGKDRTGELRKRWQGYSWEPLLFIEMYPDTDSEIRNSEFGDTKTHKVGVSQILSVENNQRQIPNPEPRTSMHVEDYQLVQLERHGIRATKKTVTPRPDRRVILYPEKGFKKTKWPAGHFLELYKALKDKGLEAYLLQSPDLKLDEPESLNIEDLEEVKRFFQGGGTFMSNDSGMAHLAGASGLSTVTIFTDSDPAVWHPRGRNISLRYGRDTLTIAFLATLIPATDGEQHSVPNP